MQRWQLAPYRLWEVCPIHVCRYFAPLRKEQKRTARNTAHHTLRNKSDQRGSISEGSTPRSIKRDIILTVSLAWIEEKVEVAVRLPDLAVIGGFLSRISLTRIYYQGPWQHSLQTVGKGNAFAFWVYLTLAYAFKLIFNRISIVMILCFSLVEFIYSR